MSKLWGPKAIIVSVLLAAACEKPVVYEVVTPRPRETPVFDASFTPFDAGSDEAGLDAGQDPSASPTIEVQPREFSKLALLEEAASCAVAHYSAFRVRAEQLRDATARLSSEPSDENRSAARAAWLSAKSLWQQAELFRFGPAAQLMFDPGGRGLRDQIYAFPSINVCIIDQSIVAKNYETALTAGFIGTRGLGAMEYLLFVEGPQNACSASNIINQNGSWAALGADEIDRRRAAYAAAAAADIVTRIDALLEAWDPARGNFTAALTNPTAAPYASEQTALNAVSHGLFYLEKEIKDYKLGLPLGLVEGCVGTCPELLESRYSQQSIQNIRDNLRAFRKLFAGCGPEGAGLGFDDWLRAAGAVALADDMMGRLDAAQRAADGFPGTLEQAIVQSPGAVQALHASIKALNDLVKTEFVSALNLELPMTAEGDND